MATITRFEFDTVFDAEAPAPEEPVEEEAPPAPSFTEAELAAAADAAFARGREAGLADATAAAERTAAEALTAVAARLATLGEAHREAWESCRCAALGIATAITRKMVPQAMQEAALPAVEALVRDILPKVLDEPRVVIRIGDALLDALQQRIETIARQSGYGGQIILLAEDGLEGPDCRIEWADGGAEYETGRLWQDIDGVIDRYLHGIAEDDRDPADPPTNGSAQETPDG